MNVRNEHSKIKLGEIWPLLKDIDMETEELDLPVRVYNFLKRGGIHSLQQLLERSYNDLIEIKCLEKYRQGIISCVMDILKSLSDLQYFKLAANIWKSEKTLTDKHTAYHDIIMNHPDCDFPVDVKHYPEGGLHNYLRELIAWEEKSMMELVTSDSDSEYVLNEVMNDDYIMISKHATYEEAQRAVCHCNWKDQRMVFASIARTIGQSGKSWKHLYSVALNRSGEPINIEAVHFDDDDYPSYDGCPYGLNNSKFH